MEKSPESKVRIARGARIRHRDGDGGGRRRGGDFVREGGRHAVPCDVGRPRGLYPHGGAASRGRREGDQSTLAQLLDAKDNILRFLQQIPLATHGLGSHGSRRHGASANPRFLILPWITIPNLGSHILSLVRRQLPQDWSERYHTTPVLIETFVETPRFAGALFKASGWFRVGTTQGRGRYDRHTRRDQPKKDIWLRPCQRTGGELSTGDIMPRCHRVTERKRSDGRRGGRR